MYIQITTRCNMTCAHCGMNCTAKGEDMTFKTFKQAIEMSDLIVIGGGEPTVHPQIEKFIFYAVANCEDVCIITNGKLKDKAIAIARLSDVCENFNSQLSQDQFHDPIDVEVIKAFGDRIRDTSNNLVDAGRCDFGFSDECICDGNPFVRPNGNVYQCGCLDSPCVGNVFDGFEPLEYRSDEEYEDPWQCYKKRLDYIDGSNQYYVNSHD